MHVLSVQTGKSSATVEKNVNRQKNGRANECKFLHF